MVFYYLKNRVTKSESRLSTVQEIAVTGEAYVTLKSSFPAEEIVEEDNFRSLLFYYGMLIAACEGTELHRLIIVYAGWEMKACEVCVSDADCMVAAKTVKNS